MPIAVPYARVSDRRQVENLSIATQLDYIRRWCEIEELELGPSFVDAGESAKTADRTQLQRLLAYCRAHRSEVACVVVFRLDRWTRELRDYLVLSEELGRLGIPLRSVTEAFSTDEDGEMHSLLTTLMAQWENRRKARRTREGMRYALERGRWVWRAPLGFLNGRRGGPSLLPDPERAPLVQQGFELVASGALSALAALDRLSGLGLRTRAGRPLTRQSWSQMLHNPVYKGRLVMPAWGIDAAGEFQPLVAPETWRRVQLALAGRLHGPGPRRHEHPDFPLRRFCRCGACATPLTASWSLGHGGRYAYYFCRDADCRRVRVRREEMHERFTDHLRQVQPTPAAFALLREALAQGWQRVDAERDAHSAAAHQAIDTARERRARLIDAYVYQGALPEADYRDRLAALDGEILQAEERLAGAEAPALGDLGGLLDYAERLVTRAADSWRDFEPDLRRRFQHLLFPAGISFDSESGFGTSETCILFSGFQPDDGGEDGMVPPAGFEPALIGS